MKAYKYHRGIQTWHWSQSVSESIIYIPEAGVAFYNGSNGAHKYKGITTDAKIIDEGSEYVEDIKSGKLNKFLNEEHKEMIESNDNSKTYDINVAIWKDKFYIKEIPEHRINDKTVTWPVTLINFDEVEIDITPEQIRELDMAQVDFTMKKSEFALAQKEFENKIDDINNLIKKV